MSARPVDLPTYVRRMLPFMLRYWKLVVAVFLVAGLHASGTFSRVLLTKPFLEKVFRVEVPPRAGAVQPAPVAPKVLRYVPRGLREKRWVRILAAFTEKDARVEGADVREYFFWICMLALFLAVLLGVSLFFKIVLARLVVNSITMDLRNWCYRRLIHMDVAFFDRKRSGDLLARVTADLELARQAMDQLVGQLLDKPVYILIGLVTCLFLSWQLSLVCFVALPVVLAPIVVLAKKIRRGAIARQHRLGDITDAMVQTFSGIRVIKAFGLERQETESFGVKNRQFFRKDMSVARARALSRASTEFLYTAGIAALLLVLGALFISSDGEIGFGGASNIIMFFLTLGLMYQPLKLLVKAYTIFQESAAGAERVFEAIDQPLGVEERPGAVPLTGVEHGVSFEGVRFRYKAEEVLRGVDLEVPAGATVAVVGPSGAGKSTLLDLIPRFYDVTGGAVKIDGRDVRDYTLESLYANIAVVQQDPFLFNTTIRENIRCGRPSASDPAVEAAARAAQVETFVAPLPDGYDTMCGERGALLSGGERQRVTIARAMLKDAPILLLDEATSSLDTRSERAVQRALEELMRGRTTLVIAHRLSTVRHADLIVVMKDGEVVEQGTHDELLALDRVYAQLHRLQHPEGEGRAAPASRAAD